MAKTQGKNGRKSNGQYAKGHKLSNGSPGRKPREVERRYLEVFKRAVSESDWKAIVDRAKADAKLGDDKARKFIADYLMGPPVQKVDAVGDMTLTIIMPKDQECES